MRLVFAIILTLVVCSKAKSEFCCVRGFTGDAHGVPLIGASVIISGTARGALSDTSGNYFIDRVPVGSFEASCRMAGLLDQTLPCYGIQGDTLVLNFALGPRYMPDITWRYREEALTDTIYLKVSSQIDTKNVLPQVWVNNHLYPCWQKDRAEFTAVVPSRNTDLEFSLFPYPPVSVALDDWHSAYLVRYPFEEEGVQTVLTASSCSHSILDISEWGNPVLKNWGLLGTKSVFQDGETRMLLCYCEQAVLANEAGDVEVIDFPFATFHFRTDPELKYLLVWDICGKDAMGGDAAIISLENGRCAVFDPSPERAAPDIERPSLIGTTVLAHDYILPATVYHVTSEGYVIRLDHTDLRLFDNSGNLLSTKILSEYGLSGMHFSTQFLSDNQRAVTVLHTDDSLHYVLTMDFAGNILHHSPIPFAQELPVLRAGNIWDCASSVLWISPLYQNKLVRINYLDGQAIQFSCSGRDFCASEDRRYLGVRCSALEVRNWDTGEILATVSSEYSALLGITNDFELLLEKQNNTNTSQHDLVIADPSGTVLQRFPGIPGNQLDGAEVCIAPDGSFLAIPFGRYFDLVTIDTGDGSYSER